MGHSLPPPSHSSSEPILIHPKKASCRGISPNFASPQGPSIPGAALRGGMFRLSSLAGLDTLLFSGCFSKEKLFITADPRGGEIFFSHSSSSSLPLSQGGEGKKFAFISISLLTGTKDGRMDGQTDGWTDRELGPPPPPLLAVVSLRTPSKIPAPYFESPKPLQKPPNKRRLLSSSSERLQVLHAHLPAPPLLPAGCNSVFQC